MSGALVESRVRGSLVAGPLVVGPLVVAPLLPPSGWWALF